MPVGTRACGRRARPRAWPPPAWLASPTPLDDATRHPGPLSLLPRAHPLPCPSRAHPPERSCRLSPVLRPLPSPRPLDASRSFTATPDVSKLTRSSPYALHHRHRLHLLPRAPMNAVAAPPSAGLPRAPRASRPKRCELLHLTPLFPSSIMPRNRRPLADRIALPPGLVANVAPVTNWSRACARCARSNA